jgi:DNA-binding XRE family transcriptional regulator
MGGKNSLKEVRESLLMSKAELARDANVSPITISRIEQGLALSDGNQAKDSIGTGPESFRKRKNF